MPTVVEPDVGEIVAALALSPVAAKAVPDDSGSTPPASRAALALTTAKRRSRLVPCDIEAVLSELCHGTLRHQHSFGCLGPESLQALTGHAGGARTQCRDRKRTAVPACFSGTLLPSIPPDRAGRTRWLPRSGT